MADAARIANAKITRRKSLKKQRHAQKDLGRARPLLIAAHRGLHGVAENHAGSRKTIARKPAREAWQ
jgi:hypothetical protein